MRYQDFEMLNKLHTHTSDAAYSLEIIQDSIDMVDYRPPYTYECDPNGLYADGDMEDCIALMEDIEQTIRQELKTFDRNLAKTIAKREELRALIGI